MKYDKKYEEILVTNPVVIHDLQLQLDRLQYLADCRRGKRGGGGLFSSYTKNSSLTKTDHTTTQNE